jgi:polyisoprenoid-binding protein YceI
MTQSTWDIDTSHTTAQFSVRHMMVSTVKGTFQGITGSLKLDESDITKSQIEVSIDTTTIDSRDAKRDEHLKSADFFDVANHPKITFSSTKVDKHGEHLHVQGNLSIHGVTKSVTLEVEGPTPAFKNPWGQTVRGVHAHTKINRKDWNLNWNVALEAGGILVGEEVKLELDVELTLKA